VDRVKITEKGCKPAPALLMPSPDPNISFGAILTLAAARGLIVANIDCAPADRRGRSIGGVVERMMSLAGRIVRDDRNRAAFEKKAAQAIGESDCGPLSKAGRRQGNPAADSRSSEHERCR